MQTIIQATTQLLDIMTPNRTYKVEINYQDLIENSKINIYGKDIEIDLGTKEVIRSWLDERHQAILNYLQNGENEEEEIINLNRWQQNVSQIIGINYLNV